jgi:tetratricopeptide (TPR) repeat protein
MKWTPGFLILDPPLDVRRQAFLRALGHLDERVDGADTQGSVPEELGTAQTFDDVAALVDAASREVDARAQAALRAFAVASGAPTRGFAWSIDGNARTRRWVGDSRFGWQVDASGRRLEWLGNFADAEAARQWLEWLAQRVLASCGTSVRGEIFFRDMNDQALLGEDDAVIDVYCGLVRKNHRRPVWLSELRDEIPARHPVATDPTAFFEAVGRVLETTVVALERGTVRGTLASWRAITRSFTSLDALQHIRAQLVDLDSRGPCAADRPTAAALPGRYAACLMCASLAGATDPDVAAFARQGASASAWSDLADDSKRLSTSSSELRVLRLMIELLDEVHADNPVPEVSSVRDELHALLDYQEHYLLFFGALDRRDPSEWTPDVRARLVVGPERRETVIVSEFLFELASGDHYASWIEAIVNFHDAALDAATPASLELAANLAAGLAEPSDAVARGHFSSLSVDLRARILRAVGRTRSEQQAEAWAERAYGLIDEHRSVEATEATRFAVALHPDHETHWYNLACHAARAGFRDEALAALERATALEPSNRALAAEDDDFESLREDVRYRTLVGEERSGREE